jgi:hypothetical protein
MSTYVREKVLRIPYDQTSLQYRFADPEDARDYLEKNFKELFDYGTVGKFQFAPTETLFLDYVLEREYDADYGEFGKTRALYGNEEERFAHIFCQLIPDINMSKVRLVEFCWYNCTEAPDYYDELKDPFYQEID